MSRAKPEELLKHMPKDVKGAVKNALSDGWEMTLSGSGHIRLLKRGTDMKPILISCSPSEPRGRKNLLQELKKAHLI